MQVAKRKNTRKIPLNLNQLWITVLFLWINPTNHALFAQMGLGLEDIRPMYKPTASSKEIKPSLDDVFKSSDFFTKLPHAYCYQDLAFFCKVEVQLEKVSKLPFKFRLGNVQYVDWLEGKTDFYSN